MDNKGELIQKGWARNLILNYNREKVEMEPIADRNSKTNLLLIKNVQHQTFGFFSGYFKLDDGKKIEVKNLLGFVE